MDLVSKKIVIIIFCVLAVRCVCDAQASNFQTFEKNLQGKSLKEKIKIYKRRIAFFARVENAEILRESIDGYLELNDPEGTDFLIRQLEKKGMKENIAEVFFKKVKSSCESMDCYPYIPRLVKIAGGKTKWEVINWLLILVNYETFIPNNENKAKLNNFLKNNFIGHSQAAAQVLRIAASYNLLKTFDLFYQKHRNELKGEGGGQFFVCVSLRMRGDFKKSSDCFRKIGGPWSQLEAILSEGLGGALPKEKMAELESLVTDKQPLRLVEKAILYKWLLFKKISKNHLQKLLQSPNQPSYYFGFSILWMAKNNPQSNGDFMKNFSLKFQEKYADSAFVKYLSSGANLKHIESLFTKNSFIYRVVSQ